MVALADALQEVEILLGRYPPPQSEPCGCDACRDQSELILQGMGKSLAEVTPEEVGAAVWQVQTTWICDWSEFAHFVPAALRFLVSDTPMSGLSDPEPELFFEKLLVWVWPELNPEFAPATQMPTQDRRAIFDAVAAILLHNAAAPGACIDTEELASMVAFLAQFEAPIEPVLDEWRNNTSSLSRARLCALMAAGILHNGRHPFLGNTYMDGKFYPLPENVAAVEAIFEPSHVAKYLLEHTEDCQALPEEDVYEIGLAWHAAAQAMGS